MTRGGKRKGAGRPRTTGRSRESGAVEVHVALVPAELADLDASLHPGETRAAGLRRRAGLTDLRLTNLKECAWLMRAIAAPLRPEDALALLDAQAAGMIIDDPPADHDPTPRTQRGRTETP